MLLSLSDLAGIIKLGWKIWIVGSSKYTSAPKEFTEFLDDVQTLNQALEAVHQAAQPSAGRGTVELHCDFIQSTIREANDTLSSCEKLIAHNDHFKKSKDGYIVNIVWAITVAEHVRQQQSRIQVCFYKANFVLQRRAETSLQRDLVLIQEDNRAGHEETQRYLRNIERALPIEPNDEHFAVALLSSELSDRFARSLKASSTDGTLSITQRLDAALLFLEGGTHSFQAEEPSIRCPSTAQYLNLLKTIWLIEHVRADGAFSSFLGQALDAAWYRSIDRKARCEAIRFLGGSHPLERVSDDQLLRQSELELSVNPWRVIEIPLPSPLDANGGELLLMAPSLKTRDQTYVEDVRLFRIAENRLRIARATSKPNPVQHVDTTVHEKEIDCSKVFLNPAYAMSSMASPSIIWKAANSDQTIQELAFTSLNDARSFQQHVTGFEIRCDIPSLAGARKKTGFFDRQGKVIAEHGRIQIWKHRNPYSNARSPSPTTSDASNLSPSSGESTPTRQSTSTWTETTLRSINQHTSIRSGEGGAFLEKPVPSQIIILTEVNGVRRVISILVDEHTRMAPDKCRCSSKNSTCKETIVESDRKKLKLMTLEAASRNEGWNVAVFGNFRHEAQSSTHFDEDSVKFVSLHFDTINDRIMFAERMETTCNMIKNQVDAYHRDMRITQNSTLYNSS